MAKIYIRCIQSSSEGNCIVLYDGETHLFLDYGCTNDLIDNYLIKYSASISTLAACLVTHEHIDHVKAICKNEYHAMDFYSRSGTINEIRSNCSSNTHFKTIDKYNKWIKIKGTNWSFKAFQVIHNAVDPVCFIIRNDKTKLLYLTDTQYFYNKKFKSLDAYIIEANYGSEYSSSKSKLSKHLNNNVNHLKLEETEKLLKQYVSRKTKLFIFSHLSSKSKDNVLIDKVAKRKSNEKLQCSYLDPHQKLKQEFHL